MPSPSFTHKCTRTHAQLPPRWRLDLHLCFKCTPLYSSLRRSKFENFRYLHHHLTAGWRRAPFTCLRCVRTSLCPSCFLIRKDVLAPPAAEKHAECFQSSQTVWFQIKTNIKSWQDKYQMKQLGWFTSFATVKTTPRKHPFTSDCVSNSTLINVMLIIRSDWCLTSVLFFVSHFLFYAKMNQQAVYCPAVFIYFHKN